MLTHITLKRHHITNTPRFTQSLGLQGKTRYEKKKKTLETPKPKLTTLSKHEKCIKRSCSNNNNNKNINNSECNKENVAVPPSPFRPLPAPLSWDALGPLVPSSEVISLCILFECCQCLPVCLCVCCVFSGACNIRFLHFRLALFARRRIRNIFNRRQRRSCHQIANGNAAKLTSMRRSALTSDRR